MINTLWVVQFIITDQGWDIKGIYSSREKALKRVEEIKSQNKYVYDFQWLKSAFDENLWIGGKFKKFKLHITPISVDKDYE